MGPRFQGLPTGSAEGPLLSSCKSRDFTMNQTGAQAVFGGHGGRGTLGGFSLARAQGEGRIVLGQSAAFTGAGQLGVQFNQGA